MTNEINFNQNKPTVGISGCLLGQKVRYDGGHKRSRFCTDALSEVVEFHPLCPEMAIGLGAPRPTIRLEKGDNDSVIARCSDGRDLTAPLKEYGKTVSSQISHLSGYIFCANSPSCGMEKVKIYPAAKNIPGVKAGIGVFAREIMKANPLLPVEENGRLNDPILRENFVNRVFAYQHWQRLTADGLTPKALIAFHSQYKYLLLAHDRTGYQALGKLLANLKNNFEQICDDYIALFMETMTKRVNRRQHTNVMAHIQGHFKHQLDSKQRVELANTIDKYRIGRLPLLAPMTLLRHYLNEHPNDYIASQVYLQPHPEVLELRCGL